MPQPKSRLRMTKISRIALVDKGDNPSADVVIHKRAEAAPVADVTNGETCMETAEHTEKVGLVKSLMKAFGLGDDAVAIPAPKEEAPKVEAKVETVDKAAVEALEKRVKEAEDRAAANEAEVQKLRKEQRTAEFVAKAQAYKNLPITDAKAFGESLRKIADGEKLTEDEQKEVERILNAADAGFAKQMAEVGSDAPAEGSATAQLEKIAEDIRKNDPKLTKEQAITKAYKANPDLRKQAEAEEREQRAQR